VDRSVGRAGRALSASTWTNDGGLTQTQTHPRPPQPRSRHSGRSRRSRRAWSGVARSPPDRPRARHRTEDRAASRPRAADFRR
jgi:hypothetical protein